MVDEKDISKVFAGIKESKKTNPPPKKPVKPIPKSKPLVVKKVVMKPVIEPPVCGNCRSTLAEDPTIKKRKMKYANGKEFEDYLCDECYEMSQKGESDVDLVTEPEETPQEQKPKPKPKPKPPAKKPKLPPKKTPSKKPEPKKSIIKKPPPQVGDKELEAAREKVKEKLTKKTPVMKTSQKSSDLIVGKNVPITESSVRKVLGFENIQFADPFEGESLVEKQTICVIGNPKSGKSVLALSAYRGILDPDFLPSPYDHIKGKYTECNHKKPRIDCDYCRPTITYAITMDDKTFKPAKRFNKNGFRIIHVLRGLEHYRTTTDTLRLMTGELTIHYIINLIRKWIPEHCEENYFIKQPDFFFIDDLDILARVAEDAMRNHFGFGVFDRFDWKYWDKRNQFVNDIHREGQKLPNEGHLYATYTKWDDKKLEDGSEVSQKKPKWAGDIEKKTDTLIQTHTFEGDTMKFLAQVISAKDPGWSYMKMDVESDFQLRGGMWNLRENAPDNFKTV